MNEVSDVIIVGGGLVGTACAIALAQQNQRVTLLDNKSAIMPDAACDQAWDSRIYTISPGNAVFLKSLGVWNKLDATRVCAIDQMQIWGDADNASGMAPLQFSAYDANVANLGFVMESSLLQQALWSRMQELDIEVIAGISCSALQIDRRLARIELADGRTFTAGLVIAADGANSWLRAQVGIATQRHDYGQMGVVANFATELSHQNVARQWFRDDGVLAWLPLPGQRISMVWSTAHAHAQYLLGLAADDLQQEVAAAGVHVSGALQLVTPAAAFPLTMQTSASLVKPCVALIGDAAHQIHPLAGQGVNLGFRDVITLAQTLNERRPQQDIGDVILLRDYERARKSDMLVMRHLTHGLYSLFENQQPLVKNARNWGLQLTNQQTLLKKHLIKRALV